MLSTGASSFTMLNGHSQGHAVDNLPSDAVNRLNHYMQVDAERQSFIHVGGGFFRQASVQPS